MNKKQIIYDIKSNEKLFSENEYNGCGNKNVTIKRGDIPIMLSTPHSINHFREGNIKYAEKLTGSIGRFLNEYIGCHLIYKSKFSKTDPNFDKNSKYKEHLLNYINDNGIKFLFDIHGMSDDNNCAIEIGTSPSINNKASIKFAKFIKSKFEKNGIRPVLINKKFSADSQETITKCISENSDCICVQIEINERYRNFSNEKYLLNLLKCFKEILNSIKI